MGQFNPILGSMRGKYGGSVLYRYNGKQCIRERVITVSNPKSSKQAVQRAILATCGRFVSAFAPVLNNAIQSETSKVNTLAKIRSLNMDYLRGLAAAGDGHFNPKGLLSIMPNDYIVSRGTLMGLNPLRSAAARTKLAADGELQFAATSLVINATATASQAFPTVAVGDQITLLAVTNDDANDTPMVGYCRFALKNDSTPVFVADSGSNYKLNAAAVDTSKAAGNWADVVFMSDDNAIYMPPVIGDFVGDPIDLAAVIVSRESERLRSNSSAVASNRITGYPLDVAYPTYMNGGSSVDMPSEVYLNNDAQVTDYYANLPSALPYAVTLVDGSRQLIKLSTNVPTDASTGLSLTITRGENSVSLNLLYGGAAVSSSTILSSVQWLTNGFLALEGESGNITITAGTITFAGGSISIE